MKRLGTYIVTVTTAVDRSNVCLVGADINAVSISFIEGNVIGISFLILALETEISICGNKKSKFMAREEASQWKLHKYEVTHASSSVANSIVSLSIFTPISGHAGHRMAIE
jgi:hypothetical protein